jgi:hypothetical protein
MNSRRHGTLEKRLDPDWRLQKLQSPILWRGSQQAFSRNCSSPTSDQTLQRKLLHVTDMITLYKPVLVSGEEILMQVCC